MFLGLRILRLRAVRGFSVHSVEIFLVYGF